MQMNLSRKPLGRLRSALTIAVPAGSATAQAATLPSFDPTAFGVKGAGWGTGLKGAVWGGLLAIPFPAPGTGLNAPAWGGVPATPLSFVAPSVGQLAVVIGPTINTTSIGPGSGVSFVNTNNQVSAGSPVFGGQTAP
jgi:hypothetical protein